MRFYFGVLLKKSLYVEMKLFKITEFKSKYNEK